MSVQNGEDEVRSLGRREVRSVRFEIIVDHVARICIWRTRQHYGLTHEELKLAATLCRQIDDWIDRHIELRDRNQDDPGTRDGWLDYDVEGRAIARQLKPALGPGAEVYYFCEANEEYERIA